MSEQDRSALVLGLVWSGIGICTTVLMLRLYARVFVKANAGLDDMTMVVAWVSRHHHFVASF